MPAAPQEAPRPQVVTVMRSLNGIVDAGTALATEVVEDLAVLDGIPPSLRTKIQRLCDAVYDLDYRTANLNAAPPPGRSWPV